MKNLMLAYNDKSVYYGGLQCVDTETREIMDGRYKGKKIILKDWILENTDEKYTRVFHYSSVYQFESESEIKSEYFEVIAWMPAFDITKRIVYRYRNCINHGYFTAQEIIKLIEESIEGVDKLDNCISANDAKKQTDERINKCITDELNKVMSDVKNSIQHGAYSISGNGYLNQVTKDRLKELGYKVETGSQYNEAYYTVSWK